MGPLLQTISCIWTYVCIPAPSPVNTSLVSLLSVFSVTACSPLVKRILCHSVALTILMEQDEQFRKKIPCDGLNSNHSKVGEFHEMAKQMSFYSTLTSEEKSRMPPCMKARCVIMSNDSSPPLQTSIPMVDYDVPDEAHLGKITPTTPTTPVTSKLLNADTDTDTETIENAVVIARTVLPVPEQQPKIEKNGIDSETKKPVSQSENDSCVVDCIYFTQQCCECVIF